MAEQAQRAPAVRPISPHLQIYRWPVTMATSIAHRVSGVALAAGTLVLAWWLCALAAGQGYYDAFSAAARSAPGQIVLFALLWALAFHLLNGIRHLAWDAGRGFDVATANRTGLAATALSAILVLGLFAYAYWTMGIHP